MYLTKFLPVVKNTLLLIKMVNKYDNLTHDMAWAAKMGPTPRDKLKGFLKIKKQTLKEILNQPELLEQAERINKAYNKLSL